MRMFIVTLICILPICSFSQSSKGSFNKAEAINWLNAKMKDGSKEMVVEFGKPYVQPNPKFTSCTFFNRTETYTFNASNALYNRPDALEYAYEYTINLQRLNPASATIKRVGDKFYVDVSTTNSRESVIRKGFDPSSSSPEYTVYETSIKFGPFKTNSNLESRVLSVVKRLITSCGGKDEAF